MPLLEMPPLCHILLACCLSGGGCLKERDTYSILLLLVGLSRRVGEGERGLQHACVLYSEYSQVCLGSVQVYLLGELVLNGNSV